MWNVYGQMLFWNLGSIGPQWCNLHGIFLVGRGLKKAIKMITVALNDGTHNLSPERKTMIAAQRLLEVWHHQERDKTSISTWIPTQHLWKSAAQFVTLNYGWLIRRRQCMWTVFKLLAIWDVCLVPHNLFLDFCIVLDSKVQTLLMPIKNILPG